MNPPRRLSCRSQAPFASYLIAEHIGVCCILAAVAAGHHPFRRDAHRALAMRSRANSTRQCWSLSSTVRSSCWVGLQLPDILPVQRVAAEADPNVETWMLFTDIILIHASILMLVRFGWLWSMRAGRAAS